MTKLKTIHALVAAEYNPRRIDDAAADGLAKSLESFGDVGGITWNARTGRIVCGHQRVAQLRKLGAQLVDGALQLANGQRFPVRVVDWTEAQEKAANVSANNPHIAGTFTDELDGLLSEIRGSIGDAEFCGLRLDALLRNEDSMTFPDDDIPAEAPSNIAVIELKCDRVHLKIAESAIVPLVNDDRFEIKIS